MKYKNNFKFSKYFINFFKLCGKSCLTTGKVSFKSFLPLRKVPTSGRRIVGEVVHCSYVMFGFVRDFSARRQKM